MELIKKKSKKRAKGKLKPLFILVFAVFAFTAPFIHIFYPKKDILLIKEEAILTAKFETKSISEEQYKVCSQELVNSYKVFGFNNIRKFWYAAGRNICMLFFSFILMYTTFFITDKEVKKITLTCAFLFMGISTYYVIWTFWWRQDFPKQAYFMAIGVASLLSTLMSYFVLGHFNKILTYLSNIHKLTDFIISDVKEKYIDKKKEKDYTVDVIKVIDSLKK
ncbi:hypothetical protein [Aquimarina longa]|uniref:hypothetical protein n=1 Tax=Aquimarina longa TaxID=1080221 RepID=UPI000781BD82|nr:hypothetical protein [Aquimarina longa]